MNTGKNKYYKQSHISERKFRELLRCFALDLNAKESSQLTGISHVSCKLIYTKLRLRIVKQRVDELASDGVYELDES
jgi:transposase